LPVVRISAEAGTRPVTVLGVPARGLPRLDGWRSDFASLSRDELARVPAPPFAPALRGLRLPTDARERELPLATYGDPLRVSANVETRSGDFLALDFGITWRGPVLRARVPAAARGGRVVGLQLAITRFQRGNGI